LLGDDRHPHDNGVPVTRRILQHAKQHCVAYLALCVAVVGSGGSYAVAATAHDTSSARRHTPTTLAACVNDRTGEMVLDRRGRCRAGRHKVTWDVKGRRGATGPAGTPIIAAVNVSDLLAGVALPAIQGLTVQRVEIGSYLMQVTNPQCTKRQNVPVVTAENDPLPQDGILPGGAIPAAYLTDFGSAQFEVRTGYVANGSFTPYDYDFDVLDSCVASSKGAAGP
jgi:hypothetical protein